MTSPVRIAIVGCGRFGTYLGELIREQLPALAIAAVVEPDAERRLAAARRDGVPAFESVSQLIEQGADAIDAALLTSPNFMHCEQTVALAHAGKHVFCEKPMALRSNDCERMVDAAEQNGVRLMVGHKRRLRPAWQRLIALCRNGDLGTVRAVNVEGWHHHRDIPDWWLKKDEGGGLLHRAGVHDIDCCNALLGEPAWVEAVSSGPTIAAGFPNTIWVTIGYDGAAVAGLQVALGFTPIEFKDSFGMLVLGTEAGARLAPAEGGGSTVTWGPTPDAVATERFDDGYETAYCAELESFVAWIREGTSPLLSWREGWQTVRIMEAAYASADSHGRVYLEPLRTFA